jgi:hypothetical protein
MYVLGSSKSILDHSQESAIIPFSFPIIIYEFNLSSTSFYLLNCLQHFSNFQEKPWERTSIIYYLFGIMLFECGNIVTLDGNMIL